MTPQQENALRSIARQANSEIKKARQQFPDKNVDDICRSVLKKHRETVQATRKDPTKPKSPYLTTRQDGLRKKLIKNLSIQIKAGLSSGLNILRV